MRALKLYRRIIAVVALTAAGFSPVQSQHPHSPDLSLPHLPQTILLKTRTPLTALTKQGLSSRISSSLLPSALIDNVTPALPWIAGSIASGRIASHPLQSIYRLTLHKDADLESVLENLQESREIVYAEPYYLYRTLLIPNDPQIESQYYLELIKAYEAWNVEQGDTSITIGMLDTGLDYMHEDLKDNIQYNLNDPVNGLDDDGDGLVDNYFGWDIANDDNIPYPDSDQHGSTVAGVSSAAVNNELGIAGIGFKTRVLPIKMFMSGSNLFRFGYEAIALAADQGCQVINLSWGEAGSYSRFGEDVIRYAVLEKDVAIVAAGGNTNGQYDFYPASYPYVLSVGATGPNDQKTTWGTYGPYMDLVAPGQSIYTTANDDTYLASSGTSLSSPMVAAAVALVRSRFPEFNALQAMEKVRVNADDLSELQQSRPWNGLMGKGRLNIFRALTDITSPAIRVSDFTYSNGIGKMAYYLDTLTLDLEFQNYLYPSGQTTVTLSSPSPYVSIQSGPLILPALQTLQKSTGQVQLVLDENTPPETRILLEITYISGPYEDREYIELSTSSDWATLENGTVAFTMASDGNLGYAASLKSKGTGFEWNNEHILDNIGLMIKSNDLVMDNIPVRQTQHSREQDFSAVRNLRPSSSSQADIYYSSDFIPVTAPGLPLLIEQKIYTNDSTGGVIIEYFITNTSDSALTGFQPALYADFDLHEATKNRISVSENAMLQYTWDDQLNLFGGLEVLSSGISFLTAIDKRNLEGNSSDVPPYLSDEVKASLFQLDKQQAGTEGTGNDVAGVARLDEQSLGPGAQIRFALALTGASSLEDLEKTHDALRMLYQEFRSTPPVGYIARFCRGDDALVDPPGLLTNFYSDPDGTDLIASGDAYTIPAAGEKQLLYAADVKNGIKSDIYTILVSPADINTDFDMSAGLLLLDESGENRVSFVDRSENAVTWDWTFSNGYSSNKANPSINFTQPGTYTITLESANDLGCSGSAVKTLEVATRNPRPENVLLSGCPGTDFTVDPADADSIHIYSDQELTRRIFSGTSFEVFNLQSDTVLYVTSLDGPYESLPGEFVIDIREISSSFEAVPDTTDLGNKYLLRLSAEDREAAFIDWQLDDGLSPPLSLGTDTDIVLDYTDMTAFTIILRTVGTTGCSSVTTRTFYPEVSPLPVLQPLTVCSGAEAVIRPVEEGIYHFYEDESLNTLIGKGRSLVIPQLENDTTLFVVSIDGLLESPVAEAVVSVSDIRAYFELPSSMINLNMNPTLTLADQSSGSISERIWQLNGMNMGTEPQVTLSLDGSGEYVVRLQVQDEWGCVSEITRIFTAEYITGVGEVLPAMPYPNPAVDFIRVYQLSGSLQLFSPDGRIINQCTACQSLPVGNLSPGGYILRVTGTATSRSYFIQVK